jgi:hypothetical protein
LWTINFIWDEIFQRSNTTFLRFRELFLLFPLDACSWWKCFANQICVMKIYILLNLFSYINENDNFENMFCSKFNNNPYFTDTSLTNDGNAKSILLPERVKWKDGNLSYVFLFCSLSIIYPLFHLVYLFKRWSYSITQQMYVYVVFHSLGFTSILIDFAFFWGQLWIIIHTFSIWEFLSSNLTNYFPI